VAGERKYSAPLEALLREVKGAYADDEIARDLDPKYVELNLRFGLFSFVPKEAFSSRRLLDFGCGAGASAMVLKRLVPDVSVVGVDRDAKLLELAEARRDFYGNDAQFLATDPSGALPPDLGVFDFVLLSAVWEHLLPVERPQIFEELFGRLLKPGGVLFVNQTPHRWFPVEYHTTGLPLLNYLPRGPAHAAARHSKRPGIAGESWEGLLRNGVRGGSAHELRGLLRGRGELLPPSQGSYERLWLEASLERRRSWQKQALYPLFRLLHATPSVTVAIRKWEAA
jgi:SAM-dependent methyltransferase